MLWSQNHSISALIQLGTNVEDELLETREPNQKKRKLAEA